MDSENWTELTSSYGAAFSPQIAPDRNLLAASADLYRRLADAPATITAGYTLTENDFNRVLLLDDGAAITLPDGLPAGFRCSLRNISSDNIAITSPSESLTGYSTGGSPVTTDILIAEGGLVELIVGNNGSSYAHGDLTYA